MSKIENELRNQLEDNISAHKNILNMSKDISDVIQNIYKKLKKVEKYYFVEMVVRLQMRNIWQQSLL